MKVYVVSKLYESEDGTSLDIEIYDSLEKAKQCKQKWIDDAWHFIEDIQRDIDNGLDSIIENEEMYFIASDFVNYYDCLTISIKEKEIR